MQPDLSRIRHFALDMDGTIYKGRSLFACTQPFLTWLCDAGIGYTFLTNNTSRSKLDYVAKLRALGIETCEEQIYTPADSAIVHLRDRQPAARALAVLGTPSLCAQFEQAGFIVTWDAPQAVVVGFDTTLTYERLCRAAYWIAQGLPFIATHPDLVCPTDEPTVLVDCGSICAALTAATGSSQWCSASRILLSCWTSAARSIFVPASLRWWGTGFTPIWRWRALPECSAFWCSAARPQLMTPPGSRIHRTSWLPISAIWGRA